ICWCVALGELGARLRVGPAWRGGGPSGAVTAILVGHLVRPRPEGRGVTRARDETAHGLGKMGGGNANGPPGDVFIANRRFLPVGPLFVDKQELFPGWAGTFVVFFPSNVVGGRHVHFVVPETEVREAAATGLRTAGLLVAPDDVPPRWRPHL